MGNPKRNVFSEFIEGKMRIWFKLNNLKRDGHIGKTDFQGMVESMVRELKPTEPKVKEITNWVMNGWDILIKEGKGLAADGKPGGLTPENCPILMEVDKLLQSGGRMTEDQYVKAFGEIIEVNKDLFQRNFESMVNTYFNCCDRDNDGLISADDMVIGLRCFGMDQPEVVKMIFNEIDTGKRGKVNQSVYVAAWVEFMIGEDRNAPVAKFLCRS